MLKNLHLSYQQALMADDFNFMMAFLSGTCAATTALGYLVYRQVKEMKSEFEKMNASVEELFDRIDKSNGGDGREDARCLEDDVDNDPEVDHALQEEEKAYPIPRLSNVHSFSVPTSLNSSINFRRSSSFPVYPSALHEIVCPVYD